MEQKNDIENALKNSNIEVKDEVETVNPVADAFNALAETLDLQGAAEDGTALFGALLAMPDDQFEQVGPVVLEQIIRSLNDPNDRIALVSSMMASGYNADDLTGLFAEVCDEIDEQLKDLSQVKRDWIKQMMGAVINAINETSGISKRFIEVPYEVCNDKAKRPAYAHETDSGMDVYALEDIVLGPGERKIIPIGIKVALPVGYEFQVRPKSGISAKTSLRIANAPGTIDSGYRDEIGIIVENTEAPIKKIEYEFNDDGTINLNTLSIIHGSSYAIDAGQKIAQLVLAEVPKAVLYEVEKVSDIGEDRGGGFGSTGLK